jgi:CheY-like chemotaxis protein
MVDEPVVFLLVEDSKHDILAFERAWRDNGIKNELRVVRNGQDCLAYLHRQGRFGSEVDAPHPKIILLNNKMPAMEGLTVLEKIRQEGPFATIPVVVFTSTENHMKKAKSYDLGANAYIVKPMNYEDLFRTVRIINDFWELVEVPENSP